MRQRAGAWEGEAVRPAHAGPARRGPITRLAERLEAERDRFILWAPVLVGIGIGLYFWLPREPTIGLAVAPLIGAVGLRVVLRRGTLEVALAGMLMCTALGFAAAKLRTELVRAPVIAAATGVVEIVGIIERIEPRTPKGERLTLRVIAIDGIETAQTPARVRLRSQLEPAGLPIGTAVRLKGILSAPPQPELPGGHDFARAAWFDAIGASGVLIERPQPIAAKLAVPLELQVHIAIGQLRAVVGERIRAALPGPRGSLAEAMITGERGAIAEERIDALRDSGLSHILAISGFNMAIMAGALFGLVRAALAAFPRLALSYPIKTWAAIAGFAGAGFCLVVSGAASATTRAFVMIALMLAATALDRPAISMRNLALAALVLLLLAPESLLDVGFQMSFAAVVALMAVYEDHAGERDLLSRLGIGHGTASRVVRFLAGTLASTAIASIAVAPLGTFHFHRLAQYGLLGNVAAVPLFTFAIMPLVVVSLAAMPLGAEAVPLWLMSQSLELMMWIAEWVAALDGAVSLVPAFAMPALVAMMLGGLWICLWRGTWRMLGLTGIAAGIAMAALSPRPDVLIAGDGSPVAIRLDDGRLSASGARSDSFALAGWIEADAEPRSAKEVAKAEGFACDDDGCTGLVEGLRIAIPRTPAALADDCALAAIVVADFAADPACSGPLLVIDQRALAGRGAHALFIGGGQIRIRTVASASGARPWSGDAATARALEVDDPPALVLAGPPEGLGADGIRRHGGPR